MSKNTTIQVPIDLYARIKVLAKHESERMGLSTPLSVKSYLELITQRLEDEGKERDE